MGIQTYIIKELRITFSSKAGYQILITSLNSHFTCFSSKVHSEVSKLDTKWLKKLRLGYKFFFVNAHQPLYTTREALSTLKEK